MLNRSDTNRAIVRPLKIQLDRPSKEMLHEQWSKSIECKQAFPLHSQLTRITLVSPIAASQL